MSSSPARKKSRASMQMVDPPSSKASSTITSALKNSPIQQRHNAVSAGDMSAENTPLVLELNLEPTNPCGCCYLSKRDEIVKIWAYSNLACALLHCCYKWWVTLMIAGGTSIHLRAYALAYVLFCSKTEMQLTARGYCFDAVSQLFFLIGSILFLIVAGGFKDPYTYGKLFARIYIGSIGVHMIGSYVPQTLFWYYDGHCIPPTGMSLCEEPIPNQGADKLRIVKHPYLEDDNCFPITQTYFGIVYISTTVTMLVWWIYGIMMARSYLYWLKKVKQQQEEEIGANPNPNDSQGHGRRHRTRTRRSRAHIHGLNRQSSANLAR